MHSFFHNVHLKQQTGVVVVVGSVVVVDCVVDVVALNVLHRPPAPRNVGTPDSADTPAPVKITTRRVC